MEHENLTCTYAHADSPAEPHHNKPHAAHNGIRIALMDDGGKEEPNGSKQQRTHTAQDAVRQSRAVTTFTTYITPRFPVPKQMSTLSYYADAATK